MVDDKLHHVQKIWQAQTGAAFGKTAKSLYDKCQATREATTGLVKHVQGLYERKSRNRHSDT
jgi:hypothetical protein